MSHFTTTFRKLSQEAARLDHYISLAERAYDDALAHGSSKVSGLYNSLVTLKARQENYRKNAALALAHKYTLHPAANFALD